MLLQVVLLIGAEAVAQDLMGLTDDEEGRRSIGVIFLQGATTGGTDLIARLLKLKVAWLPMGKLLAALASVIQV